MESMPVHREREKDEPCLEPTERRDTGFALAALEEELRYLECDLTFSIATIKEEQVELSQIFTEYR